MVLRQARAARELGATELVAVATAAIRTASNRDELCDAVEEAIGQPLQILPGDEEARLSFVGAARTLATPPTGTMAVVDVGGGSTEIAIGSPDGRVEWSESFRIGSGFLADSYLRSDPPSIAELQAVRDHVTGVFEGLETPPAETAVAVGGTATSLRRLVGAELAHETLERGVRVLSLTSIDEVAQRFELDPERVRLLPAGILVLEAISDAAGAAAADRAGRPARGRDPRAGGGGLMAKARPIPGLEPSTRFGDAAALTVEIRAAEVFEHAAGVLDTSDIERVHDMRVATRRLRAAMEVFAAVLRAARSTSGC